MKSKELFMLIDQIDKRFVEEAWEGDEEDGKVIEVVLERSPFHAIKFAAAVAACIALFGVGLFTIANIRTSEPFLPNSGAGDSPFSSVESESSESSSSESSDINDTSSDIGDISNVESEITNIDEPIDEFNKQGKYKLDGVIIPYGEIIEYEVAEKADNLDYAVIYVDETNATEEQPLVAFIVSVDYETGAREDVICEKVYITGRGKYGFYYTELRGAGSMCALYFENDFKETLNGSNAIKIVGTWTP